MRNAPLPRIVEYEGFIYELSDEPLKKGDWYVDHQKYNWGIGDCIEDCDSEGLAEFINKEKENPKMWHSKKIVATNDPVLNYYGIKNLNNE